MLCHCRTKGSIHGFLLFVAIAPTPGGSTRTGAIESHAPNAEHGGGQPHFHVCRDMSRYFITTFSSGFLHLNSHSLATAWSPRGLNQLVNRERRSADGSDWDYKALCSHGAIARLQPEAASNICWDRVQENEVRRSGVFLSGWTGHPTSWTSLAACCGRCWSEASARKMGFRLQMEWLVFCFGICRILRNILVILEMVWSEMVCEGEVGSVEL